MWSFVALAAVLLAASLAAFSEATSFYEDFDVIWGQDHVRVVDGDARQVALTLDGVSGAKFQSKGEFLFGEFSMEMKLVPGDSAGTVASFYLTSGDDNAHDEIDFEFLGNLTGEPYVLHTNVFAQGQGEKEQQFYLWFDPTADFHTYTIVWNELNIIFSVDGAPVRVFKNHQSSGLPYPGSRPMRIQASLWNGDYWATRHGAVKTNWEHAPFVASYRNYRINAPSAEGGTAWMGRQLDSGGQGTVLWARQNYMIYDYCADGWRFPQGFSAECSLG